MYWCISSLEKLWLTLKLHISCMLPEWSLEKDPDMTRDAHPCPSQHWACLQVLSGAPVQKRVWAITHWGFPTVMAKTQGLQSQSSHLEIDSSPLAQRFNFFPFRMASNWKYYFFFSPFSLILLSFCFFLSFFQLPFEAIFWSWFGKNIWKLFLGSNVYSANKTLLSTYSRPRIVRVNRTRKMTKFFST